MLIPKSEVLEFCYTVQDAVTRIINHIETNAEFKPFEKRELLNQICKKTLGFQIEEILERANKNYRLQIKRGDSNANETYIGMPGEITMDTETKTVRVHDGETAGGTTLARASDTIGDWVIEYQTPTAENNYTWYRKYKSGWLEMGGRTNGTTGVNTVDLPIKMQTKEYNTNLTALVTSSSQRIVQQQENSSTEKLCFICNNDFVVRWEVTGLTA